MVIDRSYIRVKAMIIAVGRAGTHHLVSRNGPTAENPEGFHRLIGGSVELGETFREAIVREVQEELGVDVLELEQLGVVENVFRFEGELGHEIVAVFRGRLSAEPGPGGGTLTESNGEVVPVVWRPLEDVDIIEPLYPAGGLALLTQA